MFVDTRLNDDLDGVRSFLMEERAKVLSEAEWAHRMRGYGYRLRRTGEGVEVARLPQNKVLGTFDL